MEIDHQTERHVKQFHVAQKLRLVNGETQPGRRRGDAQIKPASFSGLASRCALAKALTCSGASTRSLPFSKPQWSAVESLDQNFGAVSAHFFSSFFSSFLSSCFATALNSAPVEMSAFGNAFLRFATPASVVLVCHK